MANPWEDFTPTATAPWEDFQEAPQAPEDNAMGLDIAGAGKGLTGTARGFAGGLADMAAIGVAGLAGPVKSLFTGKSAAEEIGNVQGAVSDFLPSFPESAVATKTKEALGYPAELIHKGGEKAFELTGSPLVGAGVETLGNAAMFLGGGKAKGKATPEQVGAPKPSAKASPAKSLAEELTGKGDMPWEDFKQPVKGQQELFPTPVEGQATPYNAGQAGVFEPTTPQRARAQMELPLRNDLPETLMADHKGVVTPELPTAAEILSKERADRATIEAPKEPVQADLFPPETNVHRAYTDIRAATETGGERPLTRAEFEKTHENLAKEPATAHEILPNVDVAYQKYLEQVSGKQADMFDIGSRQEAFVTKNIEETVARQVDEHPFVKKAEKELAKQEQFVSDLKDQVAAGETKATALVSELKALEKAQEKVATVRTNVSEAAAKGSPRPKSFNVRTRKQGGGVKFEWKDNSKVDQLKNIPGIAESLRDVGHALIKSPEEALALAKEVPDVKQNLLQQGINALTKGGSYLKAKVNNPEVHFTVDRFLDAENRAKAQISEKLHGEYLGDLRELSKTERAEAFELLNAADLSQKTITPEMMQRHGLSTALQQFITTHQNIMGDVLGKINDARIARGKKPIEAREAYSAMNMAGDFRKVAYKLVKDEAGNVKLDAGGQPVKEVVGVIGANSKTIGKNSLASLEEKMKAKNPEILFGKLDDRTRVGGSKGTPHEAFTDALKTLGEDNPAFKEFLNTLAEVAKDDPSNYMGMSKHTMQKKGVWGMEGRKPWLSSEQNATAFFENQSKYIEGAYSWGELANAAKDVNAVIRDGDVVTRHPNAIKLSEDYMQNALGLNPSRMGKAVTEGFNALFAPWGVGPTIPREVVGAARQVANTFMLSLNVPFLAIQLLQPMLAMPAMMSFLRGRGMDASGVGSGAKAMATLLKLRTDKPLNSMESGALKYAKDNHVYATDMVEHTNQTERGVGYYVGKITQSPAANIETGTRAAVYLSLIHALHEGGLSPAKGLYEQAHRFTDLAMNNYSQMEKPPIYNALGPIGSMAYNLKSFGHNEISRWSLYAREIAKNGNAAPLLVQMATTIVFAGAMGLPFMSQWEALYDFITAKTGHPRSLALDVIDVSASLGKSLGEKGKFAFSNGLGTLAGVDISSRVGLGDVLPSHAADVVFAGGGKLGQMVGSVAGLVMKPSEETLKSAAINLAPPFMQGPMDLSWYSKGDLAMSKDVGNLKAVARRNDADKLFKAIGLMGINESSQKQKTYQLSQLDKAYTDIRKTAMNTLTQDMFRNRPMLQKTIDKYFVNGQGDPQTFQQEIQKKAMDLNLSPSERAMLKEAASNSITKARSLQRRMQ
ncbi:MAG: hypothetical protein WAV48_04860 [Candidatus Magasanikiibacteriota bacterium]